MTLQDLSAKIVHSAAQVHSVAQIDWAELAAVEQDFAVCQNFVTLSHGVALSHSVALALAETLRLAAMIVVLFLEEESSATNGQDAARPDSMGLTTAMTLYDSNYRFADVVIPSPFQATLNYGQLRGHRENRRRYPEGWCLPL